MSPGSGCCELCLVQPLKLSLILGLVPQVFAARMKRVIQLFTSVQNECLWNAQFAALQVLGVLFQAQGSGGQDWEPL